MMEVTCREQAPIYRAAAKVAQLRMILVLVQAGWASTAVSSLGYCCG